PPPPQIAPPSQSKVTRTAPRYQTARAPRTSHGARLPATTRAMPLLLGEIVRRHARWRPDHTAYVVGPHRVTYGRLNALANRFAHALRGLGVARGERVATLAGNRLEYPAIHLRPAQLGGLPVPPDR